MVDAGTAAKNWASGMAAATQKITAGINNVSESPTAKAAQHLDKYLAGTQAAVTSGKMAQKLNNVSLAAWKAAAIAKVPRIASGAQTAIPKMQSHLSKFLPRVAAVQAQVRSMPSNTLQDRIARATAFMQGMAGPVS